MPGHKLRIELSPAARLDLRTILRISRKRWGERQRDAYQRAIDRALGRLASFPDIDRTRDDLGSALRSLPVEQHLILYRTEGETLRIMRIVHSQRDVVVEDLI